MLKTDRLTIGELKSEYADKLLDLWNDFDVIKYTNGTLKNTSDECRKQINFFNSHCIDGKKVNFAVFYGDELIGICGFPPIKTAQDEYGFFYQLKRRYWGKGFASEFAPFMCQYAFEKLNAKVIYADSTTANTASIKVLGKCGFKEIGTEKCGFKKNGYILDIIHFALKASSDK